jgi:hypothetical protein
LTAVAKGDERCRCRPTFANKKAAAMPLCVRTAAPSCVSSARWGRAVFCTGARSAPAGSGSCQVSSTYTIVPHCRPCTLAILRPHRCDAVGRGTARRAQSGGPPLRAEPAGPPPRYGPPPSAQQSSPRARAPQAPLYAFGAGSSAIHLALTERLAPWPPHQTRRCVYVA